MDSGTTRLVLGHLSKENNHPELARETVRSELTLAGMAEGAGLSAQCGAPHRTGADDDLLREGGDPC